VLGSGTMTRIDSLHLAIMEFVLYNKTSTSLSPLQTQKQMKFQPLSVSDFVSLARKVLCKRIDAFK
jgi:hypothetical protein